MPATMIPPRPLRRAIFGRTGCRFNPSALIDTPATPEPAHGTMPVASVPRSDTTPAVAVPHSRPPQLLPAPTTPCSTAVQAALDQAAAAAEQFGLRTIINDQVVAADRAQLHADVKYQQLHAAAKYQALEIAMERAAHTAAIQQMTLQMQLNSAHVAAAVAPPAPAVLHQPAVPVVDAPWRQQS